MKKARLAPSPTHPLQFVGVQVDEAAQRRIAERRELLKRQLAPSASASTPSGANAASTATAHAQSLGTAKTAVESADELALLETVDMDALLQQVHAER